MLTNWIWFEYLLVILDSSWTCQNDYRQHISQGIGWNGKRWLKVYYEHMNSSNYIMKYSDIIDKNP